MRKHVPLASDSALIEDRVEHFPHIDARGRPPLRLLRDRGISSLDDLPLLVGQVARISFSFAAGHRTLRCFEEHKVSRLSVFQLRNKLASDDRHRTNNSIGPKIRRDAIRPTLEDSRREKFLVGGTTRITGTERLTLTSGSAATRSPVHPMVRRVFRRDWAR